MTISTNFNSFLHAILAEAYTKAREISFREWIWVETGSCMIFYRGEDYTDMNELKQIFKLMNTQYPMTENGEGKVSTRDITSKELCDHIIFVTKILNENGISFEHDDLAWELILQSAGIEKE